MAVEPVAFQVGPVSHATAALLSAATLAYAVLTGLYAWRGFQAHLADRWSALGSAGTMTFLAWLLWVQGAQLLPAPFGLIVLVVLVASVVVTLTYTLGRYKERIERFRHQAGRRVRAILQDIVPEERHAAWLDLRRRFSVGPEERRKAPHLMMGLYLAVYLALGHFILQGLAEAGKQAGPAGTEWVHNLEAAAAGGWLAAGHMASLTLLLVLLFLLVPTELLRLRYPELSYPFKDVILTRLRDREKGLFGAHYYIAAAAPAAAMWLTRDPAHWDTMVPAVMALLSVTVFADAASALVGIRFGRRKWFHHPGKSYLGTVGGALVAVAVALPFVGWSMAVVSALVFAFLDAVAPRPVPVSDNILNPAGLALAYTVGARWLDPWFPFY